MPVAKKVRRTKSKTTTPKPTSRIPSVGEVNEPPDSFLSYRTLIFGLKGIGKSTLTSKLSDNSLVCMFEPRRRNLRIRMIQFNIRSVEQLENGELDPWKDFLEVAEQAVEDPSVDCLVIDTIDLAYQACMNSVCHDNGIDHPGGLNDFGAMWNAVSSEFRTKLDAIAESGIGMVFISHANEAKNEINTGEVVKTYGPSAPGQAYAYLQQACDFVFFYGKHGDKRALHFRWDASIWTACGVEDRFLSEDGRKIAAIEMPSSATAGQALLDAFDNKPSTKILAYYNDEEEEEESEAPKKPVPKKKVRRPSKK